MRGLFSRGDGDDTQARGKGMSKPPDLIKGEDLTKNGEYAVFRLEIESVARTEREALDGGESSKGWMLRFKGAAKGFFIKDGHINLRFLKAETGMDVDKGQHEEIIGSSIALAPFLLKKCFGQENVVCARILVDPKMPKPFVSPSSLGRCIVGHPVGEPFSWD